MFSVEIRNWNLNEFKSDPSTHKKIQYWFLLIQPKTDLFTIFRLIWTLTEWRLIPNQSEKCNYNRNLYCFLFQCMDQSNYIPCYNIFDAKSIFVIFLYRHYLLFRSIDCSVALLFDDNKIKMARKPGKI